MEIMDVHKLFNLLESLYNGQKRPRDEVTMAIWATVLKPWSYAEVRDAVIQRARNNRHFPDPSEIAAYLPKPEEAVTYEPIDVDKYRNEKHEEIMAWRHAQYRAAGIPNAIEAKRQGIPFAEWKAMVDAAFPNGVPDPEPDEIETEFKHEKYTYRSEQLSL